jgi:uncharacterized Ntn-hydrolase superfamily protein
MAISSGVAIQWKELAMGGRVPHITAGYTGFKIALYSSLASLSNGTSLYKTDGEISASTGGVSTNYTTGGNVCTVLSVDVDGSVAYIQFADQTWTSATFGADGCLIYNTSTSTANHTIAVIDFSGTKTATNGTFTITMPAAGATTSIVRLA